MPTLYFIHTEPDKKETRLERLSVLKAKLVHLLTDYVPITESVNTNK